MTPQVVALARWMNSWPGIGAITRGMARQGYDLQLTEYSGEAWRATFYVISVAHSIVKGSAYEPTPWRAVRASRGAVQRTSESVQLLRLLRFLSPRTTLIGNSSGRKPRA